MFFLAFSCKSQDTSTTSKDNISQIIRDTFTIISVQNPKSHISIDSFETATSKNRKQSSNETHHIWNDLLKAYVSEDGQVDYSGFKKNHTKLLEYFKVLEDYFTESQLNKNEKLAYWINAYNAFTIDLILRHYPIKSIKDIKNPWDQRLWKLKNTWYSLNDIEHTILRKMQEPRIHFAIVCASVSCPNLQNEAFQSSILDKQLTIATTSFLSDTSKNKIEKNHLELSKIFQWFSKDFKQNGGLIDFLNQYVPFEISEKATKRFKTYNWNLNEL
ncbi:DUF547 domain-containing protein [Tamlana fucoidanivorans]|uniref:DUF547 domain-containing protein n=2 Tax=Allotamlana fucoidanivorans TaxID=2583814 RepID=A0A5C4SKF2_9FLAO|nr:DUF547 domain-containing protein [Tamlana fucoidanivorans]